MPKCGACQRRVWIWQASLLGGNCALCRRDATEARKAEAAVRNDLQRKQFEGSSVARRALIGARRGAVWGTLALLLVGATVVAAVGGEPGSRYPSTTVGLGWLLTSLVLAATGVASGYWLAGFWGALLGVALVGLVTGAVVGAVRGARGVWTLPS